MLFQWYVALLSCGISLWDRGGSRNVEGKVLEASGLCGRKWEALLCVKESWVLVCSCYVWASVGVDCEMLPPSGWEEGEMVLLCVGKPLQWQEAWAMA